MLRYWNSYFLSLKKNSLVYRVVLVWDVQQSDSVIQTHIFTLFQFLVSYRVRETYFLLACGEKVSIWATDFSRRMLTPFNFFWTSPKFLSWISGAGKTGIALYKKFSFLKCIPEDVGLLMELTVGADVDYISAANVEFITCMMQIWKEYYLYMHDI